MDDFDRNKVIKRPMLTEDRLSGLPDELLHQILSCLDTKYVVQISLLSPRWKNFWRSMPCLTLSSQEFDSLPQFSKFVTKVLRCRNHHIDMSSIKLVFNGPGSQPFVKRIARYAFRHNVQELIVASTPNNHQRLPLCLFSSSSKSLKHFTFSSVGFGAYLHTPTLTPWDFPVLTTLYLCNVTLRGKDAGDSIDLFSKCLNLKNLALKSFQVCYVAVFDIITPRLENLILVHLSLPSVVVNVIAPQLENLTVIDCSIKYLNPPPGIAYTKLRTNTMELLELLRKQENMQQLSKACIRKQMAILPKALALVKKKMQSTDSNNSAQIEAELAILTAIIQACVGRLHDLYHEEYKNFEANHSKEMQIITVLLKNLPTRDRTDYAWRLNVSQTLHRRLLSNVEDSSCCNKKIIDVFKEHDVSHYSISTTIQDIARIPEDWAKRFEFMQSLLEKGIDTINKYLKRG